MAFFKIFTRDNRSARDLRRTGGGPTFATDVADLVNVPSLVAVLVLSSPNDILVKVCWVLFVDFLLSVDCIVCFAFVDVLLTFFVPALAALIRSKRSAKTLFLLAGGGLECLFAFSRGGGGGGGGGGGSAFG